MESLEDDAGGFAVSHFLTRGGTEPGIEEVIFRFMGAQRLVSVPHDKALIFQDRAESADNFGLRSLLALKQGKPEDDESGLFFLGRRSHQRCIFAQGSDRLEGWQRPRESARKIHRGKANPGFAEIDTESAAQDGTSPKASSTVRWCRGAAEMSSREPLA